MTRLLIKGVRYLQDIQIKSAKVVYVDRKDENKRKKRDRSGSIYLEMPNHGPVNKNVNESVNEKVISNLTCLCDKLRLRLAGCM